MQMNQSTGMAPQVVLAPNSNVTQTPSDVENWKVVHALPLVQALPLVHALHPNWYRIPPEGCPSMVRLCILEMSDKSVLVGTRCNFAILYLFWIICDGVENITILVV